MGQRESEYDVREVPAIEKVSLCLMAWGSQQGREREAGQTGGEAQVSWLPAWGEMSQPLASWRGKLKAEGLFSCLLFEL